MITLRDILKLVNFRSVREDQVGMYHNDTLTVRVYLDTDEWFEFGFYQYHYDSDKTIGKVLTKDILDLEVLSIRHANEVGILEIHLSS